MKPYKFIKKAKEQPCPVCGSGKMRQDISAAKYLYKCDVCGNYMKNYVLTPKQSFIKQSSDGRHGTIFFIIGGKGGGKTFLVMDTILDIITKLTGEHKVRLGAITLSQLYSGIYKEIINMIPPEWVLEDTMKSAKGKRGGLVQLNNGVILDFQQTTNVGSLKTESYIIQYYEEITEGNPDFYKEAPFRSRGDTGIEGTEALVFFVTNSPNPEKPEQFWIIEDIWFKCHKVFWAEEDFTPPDKDLVNEEYVGFVIDSEDNQNLTERFKRRAFSGLSKEQLDLHSKGFVLAAGDLIYPLTGRCIEQTPHNYQPGNPWFAGVDYGVADDMVIGFYTIDPHTYIIYKIATQVFNRKDYREAVAIYRETQAEHGLDDRFQIHRTMGCYKMFQQESDLTDIATKWRTLGIYLERPGIYHKMPRIGTVRRMMEERLFRFNSDQFESINQHMQYKMIKKKATGKSVPQEKNDHICEETMNALSWLPKSIDEYKKTVDRFMAVTSGERKKVLQGSRPRINVVDPVFTEVSPRYPYGRKVKRHHQNSLIRGKVIRPK